MNIYLVQKVYSNCYDPLIVFADTKEEALSKAHKVLDCKLLVTMLVSDIDCDDIYHIAE